MTYKNTSLIVLTKRLGAIDKQLKELKQEQKEIIKEINLRFNVYKDEGKKLKKVK